MSSHRGAGTGFTDDPPGSVAVDERAPRPLAAWPNSREARERSLTRTGRRTAVAALPAQRTAPPAAAPSPTEALADLAALLGLPAHPGVPGQRTGPGGASGAPAPGRVPAPSPVRSPRWADGMPPAHPSAPVPAPAFPHGHADAAPRGRASSPAAAPVPVVAPVAAPLVESPSDLLPSRRSRRAAMLLDVPVDAPSRSRTASPAPSPSVPAPAVPAGDPDALAPTRRSRRAALVPVDAPPPATAPARPGSRRALREQGAGGAGLAERPASDARAPRAPRAGHPEAMTAPSAADADVLARLEALLAEPSGPWEPAPVARLAPAAPPAPVPPLDLRTDPELPRAAWARLERPAHTEPPAGPLTARAPGPVEEDVRELVLPAPAPAAASALLAEAVEEALAPGAVAFVPRRGRASHRLPKRARAALPQVAVVGVLGFATLVAPLVGTHLRAEADTGTTTASAASASTYQAAAAAGAAAAADLVADRASAALSRTSARDDAAVKGTTDRAQAAKVEQDRIAADAAAKAEQDRAAAEAAEKAAEAHRQAVAGLVGDCSGDRPDVSDTRNGRLKDSQMCDLWVGSHQLRSDAALAFAELDLAYREHFGSDIAITDSYRSYSAQVSVRRKKPSLAAVPGTSEHGWGLAVDLGGGVQNSDEHYDWLIENAPKFGWDHPSWARKGGSGPYEPWHWEYVAGE